ncbi:hypothetical protein A9G42_05580 [Gilliamella sp. Nev6-6]|uniref:hypothetical protein n=1 Tax=Gilliamella sp. Nev6-6 TaxID=3120252 RepID=UPI00080F3F20|nr:hypothetical protein [Gilliamella apicola]OCG77376.1 hypothetical protein A9G42_05580 [Gilliamella apicola]
MPKLTVEEKQAAKEKAVKKARALKEKAANKKKNIPQVYSMPEQTGNPEIDSKSDLNEVQAAFRKRMKMENARFQNTTDSEYWFAMCFQTRAQKEAFLRAMDLFLLGDKYLDGVEVAEKLGIDIPDANIKYLPDGKIDKDFAKFVE